MSSARSVSEVVSTAMARSYQPMTLADLARHLGAAGNDKIRWKLAWEFLEKYRWEPANVQVELLRSEPVELGEERWDALILLRPSGRKGGCSSTHGFPPNWRSSGPMRWSGRSASTASTCP